MTVTSAFLVLAVELDSGTVFLSADPATLGTDALIPAVLEWSAFGAEGGDLSMIRQALPAEALADFWSNREAAVLSVNPDAGSVYDGEIIFDGVIAAEPDEEGGVLSIQLIPPRRRVVAVPDLGIITADVYPLASDAAMGSNKPMIFGTVEDCPLLPVRLAAATTLSADALPGDGQLEVADASALAASGTVMVDGHAYTYSAKSSAGNTLLGMSITSAHRTGTACVQSGDTVFLAAGHACSAINDIRAAGNPISGGSVNLSAASLTFNAPPLTLASAERFTLTAQFDQVGAGATALNAINAIRAVTGTVSQSASTLPANVTAATQNAAITFARPSGRIVKGVYTVAFTVAIGAQIGWARVKIGNEVVWMMEAPSSVIYNWSPATILFDDDSDILPVTVEVEAGGSSDQVSVTITITSRLVSLGNLDDANFATLKSPSNLLWRADQADAMPDRGPISSAKLWVRWFVNGNTTLPAAAVSFAGRSLGNLAQTQLTGATLNQTVSVDVLTQGVAALPQQNISTIVGGGTASLSHAAIPQKITLPASFSILAPVGGLYPIRGFSLVPPLTGWDTGQGVITVTVTFACKSATAPDLTFGPWANIRRADNTVIAQASLYTLTGWVQIATDIWQATMTINEAPASVYWDGSAWISPPVITPASINFSYNARLTSTAVAQANTPASGYSNPVSAQSLAHSGISLKTNNGAISITVPAPPRVIDTLFDLSWVRNWPDLTGQAEIAYASGGPDLCLNQVALLVEYDAQVQARAETMTATVSGSSANPADVIATLALKTGQKCDPAALNILRSWCSANAYNYGRRIADTTDSLQSLTYALDQVNAIGCQSADGLAPVRRLDMGREVLAISESDLLAPARITWADRVENALTLRYRTGSDGSTTRALLSNAASNNDCRQSVAQIRETRPVEIEAGWIRDDATAARYLSDLCRLQARPRRVLNLSCTFAMQAREGDLIEYLPSGTEQGDGIFARITQLSLDGPWPSLTAEQLL